MNIISRINDNYVEPILPRDIFLEAQKLLTGIAKIDEICAKEYMCEDGCTYYNRDIIPRAHQPMPQYIYSIKLYIMLYIFPVIKI